MPDPAISPAELRRLAERARRRFEAARRAERSYARQLRQVARAIGDIVGGFMPAGTEALDLEAVARITALLENYSELIRPWAERVALRMIVEVGNRDAGVWSQLGRELGISLRREIEAAPTGLVMRRSLLDQVELISSLPREAAERVHTLTTEALVSGRRAKEIAAEIMRSGEVSRSRANTIARTEVGRTATEMTKARAEHIGSEGYIWQTAGDADVRPDHKRLQGRFFRWDDPPVADRRTGIRAHAGSIWECRCVPQVVIPAHFLARRLYEVSHP